VGKSTPFALVVVLWGLTIAFAGLLVLRGLSVDSPVLHLAVPELPQLGAVPIAGARPGPASPRSAAQPRGIAVGPFGGGGPAVGARTGSPAGSSGLIFPPTAAGLFQRSKTNRIQRSHGLEKGSKGHGARGHKDGKAGRNHPRKGDKRGKGKRTGSDPHHRSHGPRGNHGHGHSGAQPHASGPRPR